MHAYLFFLDSFALVLLACFCQLFVTILTQGHTCYLQLLLHSEAHNSETWKGFYVKLYVKQCQKWYLAELCLLTRCSRQ